jgi:hypothetical protein
MPRRPSSAGRPSPLVGGSQQTGLGEPPLCRDGSPSGSGRRRISTERGGSLAGDERRECRGGRSPNIQNLNGLKADTADTLPDPAPLTSWGDALPESFLRELANGNKVIMLGVDEKRRGNCRGNGHRIILQVFRTPNEQLEGLYLSRKVMQCESIQSEQKRLGGK